MAENGLDYIPKWFCKVLTKKYIYNVTVKVE